MSEKLTYKPEQVKASYDRALVFEHAMDKQAEIFTPITQEDKELQKQMQAKGKASVDEALQVAKHYADENGEALEEQARFEMDSDVGLRKRTAAGFEKTQRQIEDLPESDGPDN